MNSLLAGVSGVRSQSPYQVIGMSREQAHEMILINERDAAAAYDSFARIQKFVVMRDIHDLCLRVSYCIDELLNTTMGIATLKTRSAYELPTSI